MPSIDHEAHSLRADLGLWCGGTLPPTTVEVKDSDHELYVSIYADNHDPESGILTEYERREAFLTPLSADTKNPDTIQSYAVRAIDIATVKRHR